MTFRTLPFPIVVFVSALAAGLVGMAMRYGIIELPAINEICSAASASPLCAARAQTIVALMHTPALGLFALASGFLALCGHRRTLIIGAVAAGALGLFLYNVELGACGLLLGAISAVRA